MGFSFVFFACLICSFSFWFSLSLSLFLSGLLLFCMCCVIVHRTESFETCHVFFFHFLSNSYRRYIGMRERKREKTRERERVCVYILAECFFRFVYVMCMSYKSTIAENTNAQHFLHHHHQLRFFFCCPVLLSICSLFILIISLLSVFSL